MDKIRLYIQESVHELLHKVHWPSWEELQHSTMIVLVASIITSLTIFFMDFVVGANPGRAFFEGILHYVYQFIIP